jgi:hypothetical protein
MIRQKLRLVMPVLVGMAAATLAASCSEDSSPPSTPGGASGTGGASGASGSAGRGGASGSGGGGASGASGSGGSVDAGDYYVCYANQNKNPDPGGTAAAGADCCHKVGTCTARSAVNASILNSLGKSDCSGDNLCAPKNPSMVMGLPNGQIPKCTGTYGSLMLEGRCLPRCLTLGNKAAASLGAGDCPTTLAGTLGIPPEEVVCAPCFNPIDGTATGACSQFGDTPATSAPAPFTACGGFDGGAPLGLCVPTALVMNVAQDTTLIPQDTCGSGLLCAPRNKILDPNMCFAKCQAAIGGDGACVATYIVEGPNSPGKGLSGFLGQGTPPCPMGETCTPCINPVAEASTPTPTGACRF